MVGPATLPALARAFDPHTGYVLLSEHAPLEGAEWNDCLVPLTADGQLEPTRLTIARLKYDVLFETSDFLRAADKVGRRGALAWQFAKRPRADVDFNDARPSARIHRYHAFGLHLKVDLPHPGEVANLVALSSQALDDALQRLAVA
ncbi:hypothetical protein GA0070607_3163 [Micromonospora coriariae]|uniref:Uncharacterized protein n=1 Tax=Micromonospora coriariae TaxID=285665 RepID=A0A1C4W5L1_9ACTN|nr:hypothetical protein [Micromonospora coriariae]SCE91517.1 hypothetical protein GA0070607_3163 [Micromonospora coriariae]